jgi:hypothetical protein
MSIEGGTYPALQATLRSGFFSPLQKEACPPNRRKFTPFNGANNPFKIGYTQVTLNDSPPDQLARFKLKLFWSAELISRITLGVYLVAFNLLTVGQMEGRHSDS